ncbi:MAG: leucine-rich repeat domain-containing protein [Clostridia bacterium]
MKKLSQLFSKKNLIVFLSVILILAITGASAGIIIANSDEIVKNHQGQKLVLQQCFEGIYQKDINKILTSFYPEDSPEYYDFYDFIDENQDTLLMDNPPYGTIKEFVLHNGANYNQTEADVHFVLTAKDGRENDYRTVINFVKRQGVWFLETDNLAKIIGFLKNMEPQEHHNDNVPNIPQPTTTLLELTPLEQIKYSTPDGYKTYTVSEDKHIDGHTFWNCTHLHEVILPSNTNNIDPSWFANNNSLVAVTFDGESDLFTSVDGIVYSKDMTVLHLFPRGKGTAKGSPQGEFHIPDTITTIGGGAFANYSGQIDKIVFPASVKTIMSGAFYNTFSNMDAQLILNQGLEIISNNAFASSRLFKITIPQSVTEIGEEAFMNAFNLHEIIIPEDSALQTIGFAAFDGATNLYSIYIPQGVTKIENWTFDSCYYLSEITLHDNIESIGMFAFRGCESLSELYISRNITDIGKGAFHSAAQLTLSIEVSAKPEGWHSSWDLGMLAPPIWNVAPPK